MGCRELEPAGKFLSLFSVESIDPPRPGQLGELSAGIRLVVLEEMLAEIENLLWFDFFFFFKFELDLYFFYAQFKVVLKLEISSVRTAAGCGLSHALGHEAPESD